MIINRNKFSGNSVSIVNGVITVDGKVINSEESSNTIIIADTEITFNQKEVFIKGPDAVNVTSGKVVVEGSPKTVSTMSGDVEVRGDVNSVSTMSGDVDVEGSVGTASTVSGDIKGGKLNY